MRQQFLLISETVQLRRFCAIFRGAFATSGTDVGMKTPTRESEVRNRFYETLIWTKSFWTYFCLVKGIKFHIFCILVGTTRKILFKITNFLQYTNFCNQKVTENFNSNVLKSCFYGTKALKQENNKFAFDPI
jgi:hypothetical protein